MNSFGLMISISWILFCHVEGERKRGELCYDVSGRFHWHSDGNDNLKCCQTIDCPGGTMPEICATIHDRATCKPCDEGRVQPDHVKSHDPVNCSIDTRCNEEGKTIENGRCVCNKAEGYFRQGSWCIRKYCGAGYESRVVGSCQPCQPGFFKTHPSDRLCERWEFSLEKCRRKCDGVYKPGNSTMDSSCECGLYSTKLLTTSPGYSTITSADTTFLPAVVDHGTSKKNFSLGLVVLITVSGLLVFVILAIAAVYVCMKKRRIRNVDHRVRNLPEGLPLRRAENDYDGTNGVLHGCTNGVHHEATNGMLHVGTNGHVAIVQEGATGNEHHVASDPTERSERAPLLIEQLQRADADHHSYITGRLENEPAVNFERPTAAENCPPPPPYTTTAGQVIETAAQTGPDTEGQGQGNRLDGNVTANNGSVVLVMNGIGNVTVNVTQPPTSAAEPTTTQPTNGPPPSAPCPSNNTTSPASYLGASTQSYHGATQPQGSHTSQSQQSTTQGQDQKYITELRNASKFPPINNEQASGAATPYSNNDPPSFIPAHSLAQPEESSKPSASQPQQSTTQRPDEKLVSELTNASTFPPIKNSIDQEECVQTSASKPQPSTAQGHDEKLVSELTNTSTFPPLKNGGSFHAEGGDSQCASFVSRLDSLNDKKVVDESKPIVVSNSAETHPKQLAAK